MSDAACLSASPSSIDPLTLLAAQQAARERGCRVISVLVGEAGQARALWGRWLALRAGRPDAWESAVIPPGVDAESVNAALRFAQSASRGAGRVPLPLLLVPAAGQLEMALRSLQSVVDEDPTRPVAVVSDSSALFAGCRRCEQVPAMRMALLGGLVVLEQHVESTLNRSLLGVAERSLYGNNQIGLLAGLLGSALGSRLVFDVGRRVRGRSGQAHQLDLYCAPLRLGVQVEHAQALCSATQQQRQRALLDDLVEAGFAVLRFRAFEVLCDPDWVIRVVKARVKDMRETA
jgi:hypothetical protein